MADVMIYAQNHVYLSTFCSLFGMFHHARLIMCSEKAMDMIKPERKLVIGILSVMERAKGGFSPRTKLSMKQRCWRLEMVVRELR